VGRFVAFLGGVNVGGHRVAMDRLRTAFEDIGLETVSTYIASGNVLFESDLTAKTIETRVEAHLADLLGWEAPTFVRGADRVAAIAALDPFGPVAQGHTHLVVFLRQSPTAAAARATEALTNDHDTFLVEGAELHRLVRGGLMSSTVKDAVVARAIGQPGTGRNITTVRKVSAKLASS
jgi:uncharacterized protein (DUF1697 family)